MKSAVAFLGLAAVPAALCASPHLLVRKHLDPLSTVAGRPAKVSVEIFNVGDGLRDEHCHGPFFFFFSFLF
jgi:hypothetical protein